MKYNLVTRPFNKGNKHKLREVEPVGQVIRFWPDHFLLYTNAILFLQYCDAKFSIVDLHARTLVINES